MGRKYYSEIAEGIHESARDLFEIGLISETEMREFDELCFEEEGETNTTGFLDVSPGTLEIEHITA